MIRKNTKIMVYEMQPPFWFLILNHTKNYFIYVPVSDSHKCFTFPMLCILLQFISYSPFPRNPSISLGFPFFLLFFSFLWCCIFLLFYNLCLIFQSSTFILIFLLSVCSLIFCLLFHVLPLGAFPRVLFHMVCLFLSPVCFIPWPYIYASCLKTNHSPQVDSFEAVVQSLSQVWLCVTPWTVSHQASLSFTVSWSLLKLVHWVNDAIQLSHPLSSPSPSAFNFSNIRIFSDELALGIRRPMYWNFSFSISSFNEYSELISFRIYWFDLLAVQGTFKSLLQHHSLKASILQCLAFFIMVQLSHPYMTTGKTIALTVYTFVGKVMSQLFNTLSRFFIGFLQRSKCVLIAWLQSLFAVNVKSKKIKILFPFFPHLFAMKWLQFAS